MQREHVYTRDGEYAGWFEDSNELARFVIDISNPCNQRRMLVTKSGRLILDFWDQTRKVQRYETVSDDEAIHLLARANADQDTEFERLPKRIQDGVIKQLVETRL